MSKWGDNLSAEEREAVLRAYETEPVDDARFLHNVAEARENGFDLVCVHCGCGLNDESDPHDRGCPHYDPDWPRS